MTQAHLPYAGTSGWSGTETSRQRAEEADTSGVTGVRQNQVLSLVRDYAEEGRTVQEVRAALSLHHGQASSCLTSLHHAGALQRLSLVRNRCKVYVTPEHVAGREIEPYASRRAPVRNEDFYPRRGDAVEEWLTDLKRTFSHLSSERVLIDRMIDAYQQKADAHTALVPRRTK